MMKKPICGIVCGPLDDVPIMRVKKYWPGLIKEARRRGAIIEIVGKQREVEPSRPELNHRPDLQELFE